MTFSVTPLSPVLVVIDPCSHSHERALSSCHFSVSFWRCYMWPSLLPRQSCGHATECRLHSFIAVVWYILNISCPLTADLDRGTVLWGGKQTEQTQATVDMSKPPDTDKWTETAPPFSDVFSGHFRIHYPLVRHVQHASNCQRNYSVSIFRLVFMSKQHAAPATPSRDV